MSDGRGWEGSERSQGRSWSWHTPPTRLKMHPLAAARVVVTAVLAATASQPLMQRVEPGLNLYTLMGQVVDFTFSSFHIKTPQTYPYHPNLHGGGGWDPGK